MASVVKLCSSIAIGIEIAIDFIGRIDSDTDSDSDIKNDTSAG